MSMSEMLRGVLAPTKPKLDSADGGVGARLGMSPYQYVAQDIAIKTAASIQQWAETDDLGDGESYSDRLFALLVGVVDANKDGEITDDEQGVLNLAINSAWDYLVSLGVSEDDANLLLNEWDSDTADRVMSLLESVLGTPDGDSDSDDGIDNFVFGDQSPLMMDSAYRSVMVVHDGKKEKIRRHVGPVHMSPLQKLAIRKASMKSHSPAAMMRRAKSMRARDKMGL